MRNHGSAQLTQQVGQLVIDVDILRLAVAKLIAENVRTFEQPNNNALRHFADKLLEKIELVPQGPAAIQPTIEVMRDRIDILMRTAQIALEDD